MSRPAAASAVVLAAALATVTTDARARPQPTGVILPYEAASEAPAPPSRPPPCEQDCFLLSSLSLRGPVDGAMTFELRGEVRADEEQKIPLFGPPGQVRLDDVTVDGARATVGFDGDDYVLFTSRRSFTVRGKVTLGGDEILSVRGPLVALDAHLTRGKLVEGDRLSGLRATVLHFDPMSEEGAPGAPARPKARPVFRLARSLRFGSETSFVYRLVASQPTDLGTITLPLRHGEKVQDVQGATAWQVDGADLSLGTTGHDAEITIAGTLPKATPAGATTLSFTPDERSAYEWWLLEADPEHRVSVGGEVKLVETSQSPIPPTMPGARNYLVQRGQHLEVDARSLVRGDVLAAVARTNRRFVAVTGRGEVISDETLVLDNNGLEHLSIAPAGKAMYLSTDGAAARILHAAAGAQDVLVPVRPGSHKVRLQALAGVRLTPLVGVVSVPTSTYPVTTSRAEITIGLPGHVRPIAVLGGDHPLFGVGRADLAAAALGVALACFGLRTRRSRALGALATAGLWFVSREGFVLAAGALFVAGGVFVASRFVRGLWLLSASALVLVVALVGGRAALSSDVTEDPAREMVARPPELPGPEVSSAGGLADGSLDTKTGATPVSLSMPTSERYVRTSQELATSERPFTPRVVYVTSAFVAALHLVWGMLLAALAWTHRTQLLAMKERAMARLARRPGPDPGGAVIPEGTAPF